MGDYNIHTVKDYILALSVLCQGPIGDDRKAEENRLSSLAKRLVFKAVKSKFTGDQRERKNYRLNGEEILKNPESYLRSVLLSYSPEFIGPPCPKFILGFPVNLPVILLDNEDYSHGENLHISITNHLNDEVAA